MPDYETYSKFKTNQAVTYQDLYNLHFYTSNAPVTLNRGQGHQNWHAQEEPITVQSVKTSLKHCQGKYHWYDTFQAS